MVPVAGGMRRRAQWGTLAERAGAHRPTPPETTAASPHPAEQSSVVKPCWVTDRHGRQPGLLLEWRRLDTGFVGRVVRPVLEDDGWIVVEEWLPADLLESGMPHARS